MVKPPATHDTFGEESAAAVGIDETLDAAWELLTIFPDRDLKRIGAKTLAEFRPG